MKIRNGFVSNSSSSSFVIGKNFMTPAQIAEFHELVGKFIESVASEIDEPIEFNEYIIEYDEGTYIYEDDKYFFGEIGNNHYEAMYEFMQKNKLSEKYSVGN
jgi:hypothetical protein